jgi:hypothetical protein
MFIRMKKIIFSILAITVLLLCNSCRKALKDVNDYFPKVKTVSAIVQLDGSVRVTAEIESEGEAKNSEMENVGFCVSTSSDPKMLERQLIATSNGSSFTATYPVTDFSVDSVYYFRSWATNNYGYSYGNVICVDSIIATPVIPPCTLNMNSVNIGGSPTYYYYNVDAPDSYNYFRASTLSGPSVEFQFGSALTTGIFQTTTDLSPYAGQVNVSFYSGALYGALKSGSNVYVNKAGPASFEISICDAPWTYSTSTLHFNTHFVTPY